MIRGRGVPTASTADRAVPAVAPNQAGVRGAETGPIMTVAPGPAAKAARVVPADVQTMTIEARAVPARVDRRRRQNVRQGTTFCGVVP